MATSDEGHQVVGDEEWMAARKAFFEKEKETMRAYQAMVAERAKLPWRKVTTDYMFIKSDGTPTPLSGLFTEGKKDLVIIHMMFDDAWPGACTFCSFWADGYDGQLPHLTQRINFGVVASAAPSKLKSFAEHKGWKFPFYSSQGTTFNQDFGVEFTEEQVAAKDKAFNFGHTEAVCKQLMGASVFHKDASGTVYHTYSTYSRGIELLNITMTMLDMTPEGRYEGQGRFDKWAKHKEDYK
eukprot:CAMPEP_0175903878 /NCGR_PEP_ID=MMETSP0108-20121206/4174_1 /TAXON_ID=195067 ORGANISM="Goniomonas pacifica, Strain CCMP1869" /NCGR_SAMPLE_ID=MMETSP0108 /ASSEMBLY_ACC=CAM_ASM_000204 /LENGTH=238 /DNA_ID=CAMNT_0017225645 /DNA_START=9 /DNA_END=725 /DNA_ORIENTATION=-